MKRIVSILALSITAFFMVISSSNATLWDVTVTLEATQYLGTDPSVSINDFTSSNTWFRFVYDDQNTIMTEHFPTYDKIYNSVTLENLNNPVYLNANLDDIEYDFSSNFESLIDYSEPVDVFSSSRAWTYYYPGVPVRNTDVVMGNYMFFLKDYGLQFVNSYYGSYGYDDVIFHAYQHDEYGEQTGYNRLEFNVVSYDRVVFKPVPEPTTMLLFGAGIAGLFGMKKRIKK